MTKDDAVYGYRNMLYGMRYLPVEDEPFTRIKIEDYKGRWHPKTLCRREKRPCVIHAPSDHRMRDWPAWLRSDAMVERECAHGVYHPDPDSLDYFIRKNSNKGVNQGLHRCDGCCLGSRV